MNTDGYSVVALPYVRSVIMFLCTALFLSSVSFNQSALFEPVLNAHYDTDSLSICFQSPLIVNEVLKEDN